MQSDFSTHVLRLVQFVELSRAGWWDRAVEQLAVGALALLDAPSDMVTLLAAIRDFGFELDWHDLEPPLRTLVDGGAVIRTAHGEFSLTDAAVADHDAQVEEVEAAEKAARELFFESMSTAGPGSLDLEGLWDSFCSELIAPLIDELGARLYDHLTSDVQEIPVPDNAIWFDDQSTNSAEASILRSAVVAFLDPSNDVVRGFVLRRLNSMFLLGAARLPTDTVERLQGGDRKHRRVNVLVDTNYLIAFLGLHEDAANAAADALVELIASIKSVVDVRLYVLDETLDETRTVLRGAMEFHSGFQPRGVLARVTTGLHQRNLTSRFYQAQRDTKVEVTAENFFGRYMENLQILLREKDINLFNEPHDFIDNSEFQADLAQLALLYPNDYYRRRPSDRKNIHDLTVWYFAHSKQPASPETPLDMGFLVVSLDRTLMAFDAAKRAQGLGTFPTVIHPASLVQLLQLWSPRSDLLEQAIAGAFRLPFLLLDFDARARGHDLSDPPSPSNVRGHSGPL